MTSEARKEWTFKEDSPVLNLYEWYWGADRNNADFCKLFWAGLFGLFLLPFRILLIPFLWIGDKVILPTWDKWQANQRRKREERVKLIGTEEWLRMMDELDRKEKEKEERKRRRREKFQKVGDFFHGLLLKFSWLDKLIIPAFVIGSLALTALLIYTITLWPMQYLTILIVFAGACLLVGLTVLIGTGVGEAIDRKRRRSPSKHRIRNGFREFGNVMDEGYHSFKNKTCPVVKIERK